MKTGREVQRGLNKNEWLRRSEVQRLSQITDPPLCAVRVHRQPRKKFQKPPKKEEQRGRITSSGKELDPKHVDKTEKKIFRRADEKEWQSWVDNQVLTRLDPKEARSIPGQQRKTQ